MPQVLVEFFGIPRERAGVAEIALSAEDLGALFLALRKQLPEFASSCLAGDRLKPEYIVGIRGRLFTSDPRHELVAGDSVQILSADMGG